MSNIQRWHFYALGAVFLWAGSYVYTKVALLHFTPMSLGLLRCLIAAVVLTGVLLWRKEPFPALREWPKFILSGAAGFSVYLAFFNYASQFLTATTGCIIISTAPVMTAVLGRKVLGERAPAIAWASMALEFAGILVLTLWNGVLAINSGVFWMLGGALCVSAYNVLQRFYAKDHSPLQITTFSFITATVMMLFATPEAVVEVASAPPKQLAIMLFLGGGPSALAYLWWARAAALASSAGSVANYMFLTPLLSLILGYLVIAEVPDAGTFVGGGIILLGLLLFNLTAKR